MTTPKEVSAPVSGGAFSPPRGFPVDDSKADSRSASSDLFYYRRKYQEAYRQDLGERIQSALSDLIQMRRESKIDDDALAAGVELLLTAMVENELASCVESCLGFEPSVLSADQWERGSV